MNQPLKIVSRATTANPAPPRNNIDIPQHHPTIIDGIRVFFPFQPYDTQRDYMTNVIKALRGCHNALLESPTGTGKTLSLLCSSIAWLNSNIGHKSVIYYTSRTHMQLAQAAKELKKTAYARNPSVVIGSRAQMCLNDNVKNQQVGGDHLINRACRNAIAKKECDYYYNYEQKLETLNYDSVHDIEDLARFGHERKCCPYYASKKIAETKASIVFMPYNYLLDPSIRKSLQLRLDKCVIIFDEAHNIEGVLKDSVSAEFSESGLKVVNESCDSLPSKLSDALNKELHGLSRQGYDPIESDHSKKSKKSEKETKVNPIEELSEKLTMEKLNQVKQVTNKLMAFVGKLKTDSRYSVDNVYELMKNAGISYKTSSAIITTLESMSSFWSIASVMNATMVARYVTSTSSLYHFISLLFPEENLSIARQANHQKRLMEYYTSFKKGIYEPTGTVEGFLPKDWQLCLWCLHPAIGLEKVFEETCLTRPRSLIVTSGTLAPLDPMVEELGVKFPVMKQFDHVISEKQMKILLLGKSPTGYSLLSDFQAAKKDEYLLALGKSLTALFRILPYGTLIFFPSYPALTRAVQFWRSKSDIWKQMGGVSQLFIESKTQDNFLTHVSNYKRRIDATFGDTRAVFFGVCRGKLSEGTNLAGNYCRTVIMTGLPYPNLTDPKIIATREFQHKKNGDPNGQVWYTREMTRALNQTIGRVIRSKDDYGALILCDNRFFKHKCQLSDWSKRYFPDIEAQWTDVEKEIKDFFNYHGVKITESASEQMGAFELVFSATTNNPSRSSVQKRAPIMDTIRSTPVSNQRLSSSFMASSNRVMQTPNGLSPIRSPTPTTEVQASKANHLLTNPFSRPSQPAARLATQPTTQSTLSQANKSSANQSTFVSLHSVSSASSAKTENYSVFEQLTASTVYKCEICKRIAKEPHRTNCRCARIGCRRCLKISLHNTKCGNCNTELRFRFFKPLKSRPATKQPFAVHRSPTDFEIID